MAGENVSVKAEAAWCIGLWPQLQHLRELDDDVDFGAASKGTWTLAVRP